MNNYQILILSYAVLSIIFFMMEYYFSYAKSTLKERLIYFIKDIPFILINIALPPILIKTVVGAVMKSVYLVWPTFSPVYEKGELNITLVLVLGFIFSDFVGYILHRYFYHNGLLWKLHKTHHSSTSVRWHSAFRFNPIELCITTSCIYIVFFCFGVPFRIFNSLAIINILINYIAHSELPWGNKYIELIFVTPRYHRIHHSVEIENQKSNFSGVFTIWDRIFKSKNNKDSLNIMKLGI